MLLLPHRFFSPPLWNSYCNFLYQLNGWNQGTQALRLFCTRRTLEAGASWKCGPPRCLPGLTPTQLPSSAKQEGAVLMGPGLCAHALVSIHPRPGLWDWTQSSCQAAFNLRLQTVCNVVIPSRQLVMGEGTRKCDPLGTAGLRPRGLLRERLHPHLEMGLEWIRPFQVKARCGPGMAAGFLFLPLAGADSLLSPDDSSPGKACSRPSSNSRRLPWCVSSRSSFPVSMLPRKHTASRRRSYMRLAAPQKPLFLTAFLFTLILAVPTVFSLDLKACFPAKAPVFSLSSAKMSSSCSHLSLGMFLSIWRTPRNNRFFSCKARCPREHLG